jgi:predicted small lipoprotein YifL
MNRSAHALAALIVLAALGGCGQKGALYLPDRKKSTVPAGAPTQPPTAPGSPAPAPPAAAPPA